MNKIYLNDDSIIHKHHHHKYTKIPCEQVPRQTLLRDKYLSEFKEEWEKDKVKQNLDIPKEFKTINGESIIGKGNIDDTELRNRISNVEKNKAEKSEIPTKTSQLINNSGYIVEADLDPYALYDDIPTTTSELTNDSGFITQDDIPEYENQIVYYDYSPTLNGSKILSLVNSGKKVILRDNMGGDYFNFEFFGYSRMRRAGAAAVDFMLFMCLDGRRITWSGVNGEPGSWETNYDYNVHRSELPTKTSQFINDSGFAYVNEVPSFLDIPTHTSQLLNDSGYLTETDLPIIPTKVSELTNDTGFITRTDLPTKVSELENNVGFITHDTLDSYYWSTLIPKFDEKADKTSLNSYALKSEIPVIPTNISAFTNDAGYLTQHQNLKTINNQSIVGNGNIDIQTNVIDNLNSTSSTDALSANMGKVLKEKVDTDLATRMATNMNNIDEEGKQVVKDIVKENISQEITESTTNVPSNTAVINYVQDFKDRVIGKNETKELFDLITNIGYWRSSDDGFTDDEFWRYSDLIPVNVGDNLVFALNTHPAVATISFYNANKQRVRIYCTEQTQLSYVNDKIRVGEAYIRICYDRRHSTGAYCNIVRYDRLDELEAKVDNILKPNYDYKLIYLGEGEVHRTFLLTNPIGYIIAAQDLATISSFFYGMFKMVRNSAVVDYPTVTTLQDMYIDDVFTPANTVIKNDATTEYEGRKIRLILE